jgi:heme-degrading monooxygenase HmoA
MLGLFFDVRPKPGHMAHYFEHVDRLKPVLAGHAGLLQLERFRPLDDADALLSHQHWADEAALSAWRREATHRASQAAGRRVHFESYRIRVGTCVAASEAAGPEKAGRFVVAAAGAAPLDGRVYESVTRAGRFLTVIEAATMGAAQAAAAQARDAGAEAIHVFDIARDYTLTDRAEAPAS